MKQRMRVEGLKDLDKALGQLSKATARNVLNRVLKAGSEPIASAAGDKAPGDIGADIVVVTGTQAGKKEYHEAIKAGLDKAAATKALRDARRAANKAGEGRFAQALIGPSAKHPQARWVEEGTGPHKILPKKSNKSQRLSFTVGGRRVRPQAVDHPGAKPNPFMRPAFEENKGEALEIIRSELGTQIAKAVARQARRRAKRGG